MADLFCKDCKHSREAPNGDPYKMTCESPENIVYHVAEERYLVTGIPQPKVKAMRGASCTALRQSWSTSLHVCGPSGLWFEAKGIKT